MTEIEAESRIIISKRKGDGEGESQEKRLRVETQAALAIVEKQNIARSSSLLAPTMLLTGHQAAVYTLKFDPSGLQLATAGADRGIFLWDTRGECNNYNVLRGHKNVSSPQHVWRNLLTEDRESANRLHADGRGRRGFQSVLVTFRASMHSTMK